MIKPLVKFGRIPLSRRQFLGASASAAVFPALAKSTAAGEYRLEFIWNSDRTVLSIRQEFRDKERETSINGKEETVPAGKWKLVCEWALPRAAFGPKADFNLQRKKENKYGERTDQLRVDEIEYGRNRNRLLKFTFTSKNRGPYTIHAETEVWSKSRGPDQTSAFMLGAKPATTPYKLEGRLEGLLFSDFLTGAPENQLYQWVANGRITSTFKLIFNGLVALRADNQSCDKLPKKEKEKLTVKNKCDQFGVGLYFSCDGTWCVDLSEQRQGHELTMSTFSGSATMEKFRFGWCGSLHDGTRLIDSAGKHNCNDNSELESAVLLGAGVFNGLSRTIDIAAASHEVSLGSLNEAKFDKSARSPKDTIFPGNDTIWIRTGHSPEARLKKEIRRRVECEVSWLGFWNLNLQDDGKTICGDLNTLFGAIRQRVDAKLSDQGNPAPENGLVETTFHADFSRSRAFRVETPIGRLNVEGPMDDEVKDEDFTVGPVQAFENRAGTAVSFAITRDVIGEKNVALRWFEAQVLLRECFRKLDGTDYSRLLFAPTSLALVYPAKHTEPSGYSGFVNLRRKDDFDGARARIDMDRAKLLAGRAGDMVSLTFRFRQLAFEVDTEGTARLVSLANSCRVTEISPSADDVKIHEADGINEALKNAGAEYKRVRLASTKPLATDTRATLIVEFPPQHILEEALFRPDPPDPPSIDQDTLKIIGKELGIKLDDTRDIVNELNSLLTIEERYVLRLTIREAYEKQAAPGKALFLKLAKAYDAKVKNLNVPKDQKIYVGPIALDPDTRAIMRKTWVEIRDDTTDALTTQILAQARGEADRQINAAIKRVKDGNASATDLRLLDSETGYKNTHDSAILLEILIESALPAYQQFRTYYREAMVDLFLDGSGKSLTGSLKQAWDDRALANTALPQNLASGTLEFTLANGSLIGADPPAIRQARHDFVLRAFKIELTGRDALPSLVEGRLSQPSRLAFRIDCEDPLTHQRNSVDALDNPDEESARSGVRYLDFSFAGLTQWSAFELSVSRRAQLNYAPDVAGRLDFRSRRLIESDDARFLDRLNFPSKGAINSSDWNAHLQSTLASPPSYDETSLEIPARLILSPNQSAVFLAPQPLPDALQPNDGSPHPDKLWAVHLSRQSRAPGIRAIHSPDLRPGVFNYMHHRNYTVGGKPVPGAVPPPRGPLAPWFLDRLNSNAELPDPYNDVVGNHYPDALPDSVKDSDELCEAIQQNEAANKPRLQIPWLADLLCRQKLRRDTPGNPLRFRAPLDAGIRHELVLATSCFGMYAMGRRNPQGNVIGDSQFEPAERHRLTDLKPGAAIYRPKPLNVSELELTSLGGSIRSSTSFEPPAGALRLDGTPMFPALSIERYQQWTVLGRDIYVEVVFKGFLLPFGHRASLVQVTERRYESDPQGHVVAYLIQRMYIQRGSKDERFPALGQPFGGRACPVKQVSILTERTPDIVDPYDDQGFTKVGGPSPTGRLRLNNLDVGMAFWPRTAKTEAANVRFDLQLDEHFSTLPLLFIDNTAANDPTALAAVTSYYNGMISPDQADLAAIEPAKHISTLVFNGAKIRMADEEKPGSATMETDSWTVSLMARNETYSMKAGSNDGTNIELDEFTIPATSFEFDPILQGADRLPVYPAMRSARVYLRRNDQLTGVTSKEPVRALYDARYVIDGLPVKTTTDQTVAATPIEGNLSEVFLTLVDRTLQNVGGRGDQSGGVFRPSTWLVAVSRQNGPMGVGGHSSVPMEALLPGNYYDSAKLFDATIEGVKIKKSAVTIAPANLDSEAFESSAINEVKDLYKRYFSDDAKLLGLISFRKLIQLIIHIRQGNIEEFDPRTGMPKLAELIEFGAGSLAEELGAQDAIEFVRSKIADPLSVEMKEILTLWDEVDQKIKKAQLDLSGGLDANPIGLDQILPGLHVALQELDAALDAALSESDQVLFSLSLGDVYEAGRRLIDIAARILANIDEIVEATISDRIQGVVNFITGLLKAIENGLQTLVVELLVDFLDDFIAPAVARKIAEHLILGSSAPDPVKMQTAIAEAIADIIVGPSGGSATYPFAIAPVFDVAGIDAAHAKQLEAKVKLQQTDMHTLAVSAIEKLLAGYDFKTVLATTAKDLFDLQKVRIEEAWQLAGSLPETPAIVGQLQMELDLLKRLYDIDPGKLIAGSANVLIETFREEFELYLRAREQLTIARSALSNGNLRPAATAAVAFVELFTGPLDIDISGTVKPDWEKALGLISKAMSSTAMQTCFTTPTNKIAQEICTVDWSKNPSMTPNYGKVPTIFVSPCREIFQAYSALTDTKTKLETANKKVTELLDKADLETIPPDKKTRDRIRRSIEYIFTSLEERREALSRAAAETLCDFVNDARMAGSLERDWEKARTDFEQLTNVKDALKLAGTLPGRFQLLIRSRQRMLDALVARIATVGDELHKLIDDDRVAIILGAGGLAALLKDRLYGAQHYRDLQNNASQFVKDANDTANSYRDEIEKFLYALLKENHEIFNALKSFNSALLEFSTTGIAEINSYNNIVQLNVEFSLEPLKQTNLYLETILGKIGTLINASGGKISLHALQTLSADIQGTPVPLLDFVAPKGSVDKNTLASLRKLQAQIEDIPIAFQREMARRYRAVRDDTLKKLDKPARSLLSTKMLHGESTQSIYARAKTKRDDLHNATKDAPHIAEKLLIRPSSDRPAPSGVTFPAPGQTLTPENDQFTGDAKWLELLAEANSAPISVETNLKFLKLFVSEWGNGKATPLLISQQVLDLFKEVLRGNVLSLLPIQEIRERIEDRILEMVPTKITRSFKYGTELPPEIESATLGIFRPGDGSRLDIGMKFEIDLFPQGLSGANPEITYGSLGTLGAFDIKLVGNLIDAITLHFGGARFESGSGKQKRFDVDYRDFTIGRDLEFVQQLASFLSPGGSGPYVTPTRGFPGIEAGYGLNLGTFAIGNLSFFNISLNASAILPFDDRPTRFRASLSRRDAPFTLSYAPYGGSGFFAIDADADGIVGFEASFEFGGAAAFNIGLLNGQGRLMAGFYIRQTRAGDKTLTELGASFFVGGSASIWIFSLCTSLSVRLGMVNGNMTGLAAFTYGFSIGIKDFDFTIEWQKEEKEGFQGQQASIGKQRETLFAGDIVALPDGPEIKTETVCQSENWKIYSGYFDSKLSPEGLLDDLFN